MATITKIPSSGEGDSEGFDVNRRTETYNLIVDSVTDDPIAKFRALLPMEQPHPSSRNLFVIRHTTGPRLAPLAWRMTADYEMPAFRGVSGIGEWLMTVQFNAGTETLVQEIADDEDPDIRRQIIGPLKYELLASEDGSSPADATHKTDADNPVFLKQVGGVVIPKGLPRIAGDTSIILRSTTNHMTPKVIREVANLKRGTNSDAFFQGVFKPGELLFTSFSITERVGVIAGNEGETFLYDNQLEFAYNEEGHSPVKRTDTFTDDNGFEQLVINIRNEAPEERSFRRYPKIVFDDILKKFGVKKGGPRGR